MPKLLKERSAGVGPKLVATTLSFPLVDLEKIRNKFTIKPLFGLKNSSRVHSVPL